MNKKGFMMAELIIVAAVIVGIMTTLFVSYNRIMTRYTRLINYYDVGAIYRLNHYLTVYKNDPESISFKTLIENYTNYANYNDKLFLDSCSNLKNDSFANGNLTQDEKDYFKYLKTLKINENYNCIILETCQTRDGSKKEKCKYAYMEVKPDAS